MLALVSFIEYLIFPLGLIFVLSTQRASDLLLPFRLEVVPLSLGLTVAALIFGGVGATVLRTFSPTGLFSRPHLIFSVCVGELLAFVYFYVRSILSYLAEIALGISVPVTSYELWVMSLALIVWSLRSLIKRDELRTFVKSQLWPLVTLWLAMLLICLHELPRDLMLSSDPDLHLFFASQVKRFGVVPFHQYHWGPEPFHYPAGFAVLNFLWAVFSGLSLPNVISAAPFVQTLLAMLGLASFIWMTVSKRRNEFRFLLVGLLLLLLYYALLPYGYQALHRYLEGTARLAALVPFALLFCCYSACLLDKKAISANDRNVILTLMAFSAAWAVLINPIHALTAAVICILIALVSILRLRAIGTRWLVWDLTLAAFGSAVLVLCDPYYLQMLQSFFQGIPTSSPPHPVKVDFSSFTWTIGNAFNQNLSQHLTTIRGFFELELLRSDLSVQIFVGCVSLYIVSRIVFQRTLQLPWTFDAGMFCLVSGLVLICRYVALPFFSPLMEFSSTRLLYPYFLHHNGQLAWLLLFFLVSFPLIVVIDNLKLWQGSLVLLLVAVGILFGRVGRGVETVHTRFDLPSAMGSMNADDTAVLSFIEDYHKSHRDELISANSGLYPKILVPSVLVDLGWEHWLFGHGASRLLPAYDTFPLAFYYSHASLDYSYENYQDRVCRHLNLKWLKKRNIRFLFMPADRGALCVNKLVELLADPGHILYRSGESVFIKLY